MPDTDGMALLRYSTSTSRELVCPETRQIGCYISVAVGYVNNTPTVALPANIGPSIAACSRATKKIGGGLRGCWPSNGAAVGCSASLRLQVSVGIPLHGVVMKPNAWSPSRLRRASGQWGVDGRWLKKLSRFGSGADRVAERCHGWRSDHRPQLDQQNVTPIEPPIGAARNARELRDGAAVVAETRLSFAGQSQAAVQDRQSTAGSSNALCGESAKCLFARWKPGD